MPLPDADPDKRMYKLLKNIDLENLSFADFQTTAQTVFAEPEAEDTLRRIVLINLARMAVAGDWNGLTTSGAATQYALEPMDASQLTTYNYFQPWSRDRTLNDAASSTNMETKAVFQRFVAPLTGTIGDITIRTSATNTGKDDCKIAFYSSTNGLPGTRIGNISIDVNGGSGLHTSSSWTTAPPLTIGLTYWIAFVPEGSTFPAISTSSQSKFLELGVTHYPGQGYGLLYNNGGTTFDFPSTITDAHLTADSGFGVPIWGYKYA
jgi:hypothetical protein